MSILKNYWLCAGAVVLTLVLGFFVVVGAMERGEDVVETPPTLLSQPWYFTGDENSDTDDPSNYSPTPLEDVECGGISEILCSINDTPDPANPTQPNMSFGPVSGDTADQYNKSHRVD